MSYYAAGGWLKKLTRAVSHAAAPVISGIKLNNKVAMQYARSWVGQKVGAAATEFAGNAMPSSWKDTLSTLPAYVQFQPGAQAAVAASNHGTPGHQAHAAAQGRGHRARAPRRTRRR